MAESLIGMSVADAEAAATDAGFAFRVTSTDGEPAAVTMDYRIDRINAEVEDDEVVRVSDRLTRAPAAGPVEGTGRWPVRSSGAASTSVDCRTCPATTDAPVTVPPAARPTLILSPARAPARAAGHIARPRRTGGAVGTYVIAHQGALVDALQARLEDVDEIEAFVTGRAKEVRSVEQKLRARDRLSPGRDSAFTDLPDLIGIRVVVRLESEISIVAEELHRLLIVDKDVDARDERSREETPGYRGRHFDVRAHRTASSPSCSRRSPPRSRSAPALPTSGRPSSTSCATRAATSCPPRAAGSSCSPPACWSWPSASSRTSGPGRWTPSSGRHTRRRRRPRQAAAAMDEAGLAEFLAHRYPAVPSTPRRLGWMLELLREMRLDSAGALPACCPTTPTDGSSPWSRGAPPSTRCGCSTTSCCWSTPEAYLRANRAVPDERNPHRIRTLERRQRRLAGAEPRTRRGAGDREGQRPQRCRPVGSLHARPCRAHLVPQSRSLPTMALEACSVNGDTAEQVDVEEVDAARAVDVPGHDACRSSIQKLRSLSGALRCLRREMPGLRRA